MLKVFYKVHKYAYDLIEVLSAPM
jgi:hypothetical protein